MSADLADSQKADEEDRKSDHATLVAAKEFEVTTLMATIETNLRQGDFGVEVDSMKGDLAETENSLAGDEASSQWEERQKSRADELRSRLLQRRSSPQLMRRFCGRATARVRSLRRTHKFLLQGCLDLCTTDNRP